MNGADHTTELPPEATGTEFEQRDVERWIKELLEKGYQRLESPQGAADKKFILTARQNKIYRQNRGYGKGVIFQHSDWDGVNEVLGLDIFEEIGGSDNRQYQTVGHIDYRIGRMHDGTVANGNRGARVGELTTAFSKEQLKDPLLEAMSLRHVFREVDKQGYVNGIDVEDAYRGVGFGKLLAASGLAALREVGVEELDFNGKLSSKYKPIMTELGYNAGVAEKPPHRQSITDFKQDVIVKTIQPFILPK